MKNIYYKILLIENIFLRSYFDKLDKKDDFLLLLNYFIQTSINDEYSFEKQNENLSYSKFYEKFVKSVFSINVENVFQYCQSPIEKFFLNSLMLLFIKSRMPCLFITPPFNDTEVNIKNFRNHYKDIDNLIESYKQVTNDNELKYFDDRLKEKQKKDEFSEEELIDILTYKNLRKSFEFNSYHITPQAAFPNLKVNNKSIRTDFYIWVPGDSNINIIVECDGFQFHNNKNNFINDRIRDRQFLMNGYLVIRYSGSEIYQDPIKVSSNLFDLLTTIDKDLESTRIT